jgi:hypothetical protein
MLDQLARWQHGMGQRLCLITFNYDVLLERACRIVFGHRYDNMDAYQAPDGLHVYKPHGSVDWAQAAVWPSVFYPNDDAARNAICDRPDLQLWQNDLEVRAADAPVIDLSDQDRGASTWRGSRLSRSPWRRSPTSSCRAGTWRRSEPTSGRRPR